MSDTEAQKANGFYKAICPNADCGHANHIARKSCQKCGFEIRKKKERKVYTPPPRAVVAPTPTPVTVPVPVVPTDLPVAASVVLLDDRRPVTDEKWITLEDYTSVIDGVTVRFPKGHITSDYAIVTRLRAEGAPFVSISEIRDIVCCPNCRTMFRPAKVSSIAA